MKDRPTAPDLGVLWSDLGVNEYAGGIRFDDSARLATVRQPSHSR
jgi:hypothetical protein